MRFSRTRHDSYSPPRGSQPGGKLVRTWYFLGAFTLIAGIISGGVTVYGFVSGKPSLVSGLLIPTGLMVGVGLSLIHLITAYRQPKTASGKLGLALKLAKLTGSLGLALVISGLALLGYDKVSAAPVKLWVVTLSSGFSHYLFLGAIGLTLISTIISSLATCWHSIVTGSDPYASSLAPVTPVLPYGGDHSGGMFSPMGRGSSTHLDSSDLSDLGISLPVDDSSPRGRRGHR